MKSKKLIYGSLIATTVLLVGGFFLVRNRTSGVKIIHPKRGSIVEAIYALSTVTSRQQFHFKVGLTKTLMKVYVVEGQIVSKGQPLLELSDGLKVFAPFNGTVTALPFHTGENVFPDVPIISVEDLEDRYLVANLEQQGAIRVKRGMGVVLNFETIRNKIFSGVVQSVYPQKGIFVVRITSDSLPKEILPGMTADSSIQIDKKESVLLIPVLSINNGKVLIERGNEKMKMDVKIGVMDSEWAEVIDGDIQLTDQILIKN